MYHSRCILFLFLHHSRSSLARACSLLSLHLACAHTCSSINQPLFEFLRPRRVQTNVWNVKVPGVVVVAPAPRRSLGHNGCITPGMHASKAQHDDQQRQRHCTPEAHFPLYKTGKRRAGAFRPRWRGRDVDLQRHRHKSEKGPRRSKMKVGQENERKDSGSKQKIERCDVGEKEKEKKQGPRKEEFPYLRNSSPPNSPSFPSLFSSSFLNPSP